MNWTRRTLLQGLAAVTAYAQRTRAARLPRDLRLGLIGWEGHVGDILEPLPEMPEVKLVAVATPDKPERERLLKNPSARQAKPYDDYREMLEREQLDVAAVCNSNGERAEAVLACLRRKLPVMAEKPLALQRKDLDAIRGEVERNRIPLGLLLPMRYEPPYAAMRQLVSAGAVGEVGQIDAQKSYKAGERPLWMRRKETYGTTLQWIGIHMIDLMRWTSGRELVRVSAYEAQVSAARLGAMQNVSGALYQLDNGGVATLRMDYFRPESADTHGDDRLRLAGTQGVLEYQAQTGLVLISPTAGRQVIAKLPPKGSVFRDFLGSAFAGETPSLALQDIWRVNVITLETAQAAEQSGREIK